MLDDLGGPLLVAIERGEVPSLTERMNVDEAAAILKLAALPEVATALLLSMLDWNQPSADAVAACVLEKSPKGHLVALIGARMLAGRDWDRARRLARHALLRGIADEQHHAATQAFWRACVQHGRAAEAAKLIAETGLGEPWMPIYEALLAAGGDRDRLGRLAPEVRTPTEELLTFLQREDPVAERKAQPRRDPRGQLDVEAANAREQTQRAQADTAPSSGHGGKETEMPIGR